MSDTEFDNEVIFEAFELLNKLESTSGRNDKKAILLEGKDNFVLKNFLVWAYDPFRVYGIQKLPEIDEEPRLATVWNNCEEFETLLDDLLNRRLTGNAALDAVSNFFYYCGPDEKKWYSRILKKDLRCGITGKTVNDIFPNLVPSFDCMLAKKWEDVKKKPKSVIIEPKLDGYRVLAFVKEGGEVELFTRNGKPILGFSDIENELSYFQPNFVYDGEITGKDRHFTDMQELVFKKGLADKQGNLNIFDCVPLFEFMEGKSSKKLLDRKVELVDHFIVADNKGRTKDNILLVNISEPIDTTWVETIQSYYEQYSNEGYEGIMLKDTESYYECKRSSAWTKMKPDFDVDLPVIGAVEGTGKLVGMLGALVVDFDGNGVEVGSGFTEEQRKDLWERREEILGSIIEIKYQEETTNKQGGKSLRFPVFQRFRFDKN